MAKGQGPDLPFLGVLLSLGHSETFKETHWCFSVFSCFFCFLGFSRVQRGQKILGVWGGFFGFYLNTKGKEGRGVRVLENQLFAD